MALFDGGGLPNYNIDTSGTPQDVQRRQAYAEALMKAGSDSSPIAGGKWGGLAGGLNRVAQGLIGGYQMGQLRQDEQSRLQSNDAQVAALRPWKKSLDWMCQPFGASRILWPRP